MRAKMHRNHFWGIIVIRNHYKSSSNERDLHVKDSHNILVFEVLVYGRRGFLEQPKEDVPVQLDRLHARAEDNDDV